MNETKVMNKIRELAGKHKAEHPIGIDTLALILRVNEVTLLETLKFLEQSGDISITSSPTKSRRRTGSGSVVITAASLAQISTAAKVL